MSEKPAKLRKKIIKVMKYKLELCMKDDVKL